jgi:Outer membrane efflux protein
VRSELPSDDREEPLEGFDGAFLADPQQAGEPLVDLIDQRQVFVALGVLDFIHTNGADPLQLAMLQAPTDHILDGVAHLVPGSVEGLGGFLPGQLPRPAGQKQHVGSGQLVLTIAQPGTYAEELSKPGTIPGIPAITGADQPLDVLRRRPDIIAAERRLAASNERIGVAISDYYPEVSLSGVLDFDSTNGGTLFDGRAFQPIGTGALRWRLFDFGKVAAEVAESRGGYAEALAEYRQAALRATEDVENALMELVQTQVRLEELQGEVASLTRARDLSERAYKAGAIPLTDVLNADSELLVARNDVESTRADAARAAVRTFRALGGGWDVHSNPPIAAVK